MRPLSPAWIREESACLATALRFLTRLPVPDPGWSAERLGRAQCYFPLAGVAVGALAGAVYWGLGAVLPGMLAAGVALGVLIWLTGALHEDGLADLGDGLGAPATRERTLEIMRDSRIGSFGAIALIFGIGLRWAALAAIAPWLGVLVLVVAAAAGRAAVITVAAILPPAGPEGLGAALGPRQSAGRVAAGLGIAAVVGAICAGTVGLFAILAALAFGLVVAARSARRLGGYTGDVLGAVVIAGEIAALAVLAGTWR